MFIDASVISAMMTDEAEARIFAIRMQASTVRMTSPLAVAKAISTVSDILAIEPGDAAEAARTFLQLMNIQQLAIPPKAAFLAIDAHSSFGTGRHAANLTFEECLTYACARYYRHPLLFKDGGYAATDMEIA